MLRGALTVLRPATDEDAPMLVRWHADPEVSRYWDDEVYTLESLLEELHEDGVEPWIVEADGEPVGFIQSWIDETAAPGSGLDLFLIPSARGRGLGPDAARTLALHMLERGWPPCTSTRTSGTRRPSARGGAPASSRSRSASPTCGASTAGC
jgi:aminoglycoside 6'-N-acetyltransferase